MLLVAPPKRNSRTRECPYAPEDRFCERPNKNFEHIAYCSLGIEGFN